MYKNLFLVFLSVFTSQSFANHSVLVEEDSLIRQERLSQESAAENVFEFLDLPSMYCGDGSHKLKIKLKRKLPVGIELKVSLVNEKGVTSRLKNIRVNGEIDSLTVEFWNENLNNFLTGNMKFMIEDYNNLYKSESKTFIIISGFLNVLGFESNWPSGHCDGFSTKLQFTNYASLGSITWNLNGKEISNSQTNVFEAKEGGEYSVKLKYKECTVETKKVIITKNKIPAITIDNYLGNTICDGSKATITYSENSDFSYYNLKFPYTDFEWTLNNEVIKKVSSLNSKIIIDKPGNYTLVASQGNCKSISNIINIPETKMGQNSIFFFLKDSLDVNNKLKICKGQSLVLISKSVFIGLNWRYGGRIRNDIDTEMRALGYSFQWRRDGKLLPNENSCQLKTDLPGKYQLLMKQGNCESLSNPLEIIQEEVIPFKLGTFKNETCDDKSIAIYYRLFDHSFFENSAITLYKDKIALPQPNLAYATGKYHMIIKKNNTCELRSDTVQITFNSHHTLFPIDTIYSCTGKVKLTNYTGYYGDEFIWKHNGVTIPQKEYTLEVTKSGLYTSERVRDENCKVTKQYLVVMGKAKVDLDLFKESTSTCYGREILIRAYLNPYQDFEGNTKISLFKNSEFVFEKNAEYIFSFNYTWYGSAQIASFPVTETGEYSVRVEVPNCETISSPLKVNFLKTVVPIISQASTINNCLNSIKIETKLEQSVRWYLNDKPLDNLSIEIKPSQPGSYSARIDQGDCLAFTDKILIKPEQAPPLALISGDTLVGVGATANLKLNFTGLPPFSYKLNNYDEGSALNNTHFHPVKIETHSVFNLTSVKNACGEGTASGEARVRVNVLANEPSIGKYIKIFPIPTSGDLQIEFDQLDRFDTSIQVFNSSGKTMVQNTKLIQNGQKLDLSHLPAGAYFIKIKAGKNIITREIIKW